MRLLSKRLNWIVSIQLGVPMLRLLSLLFVLLIAASPARAEMQTYQFDKTHTQVLFFVEHMGFSHSNGKFLKFDGNFKFDPQNPATGSTEVTIYTDSLNMDDATWEEHLKAADMFNVAAFPTMTFKSTKVEPGATAPDNARLSGDLTILGVTKPVDLFVKMNKCGEHPFTKKQTCGFDATARIKRSDFGMTKGIPMVGDEVEIRITVEGSVEDGTNK